jgi:hypothetical protein
VKRAESRSYVPTEWMSLATAAKEGSHGDDTSLRVPLRAAHGRVRHRTGEAAQAVVGVWFDSLPDDSLCLAHLASEFAVPGRPVGQV